MPVTSCQAIFVYLFVYWGLGRDDYQGHVVPTTLVSGKREKEVTGNLMSKYRGKENLSGSKLNISKEMTESDVKVTSTATIVPL